MEIEYDKKNAVIKIKDGLRSNDRLIKLLLIVTIINAILNLYNLTAMQFQMLAFIWIILGGAASIFLGYKILKKTTTNSIALKEIELLKEKSVMGRKVLSLQLKNGKWRDLNELTTPGEIAKMKKMFSGMGVRMS